MDDPIFSSTWPLQCYVKAKVLMDKSFEKSSSNWSIWSKGRTDKNHIAPKVQVHSEPATISIQWETQLSGHLVKQCGLSEIQVVTVKNFSSDDDDDENNCKAVALVAYSHLNIIIHTSHHILCEVGVSSNLFGWQTYQLLHALLVQWQGPHANPLVL